MLIRVWWTELLNKSAAHLDNIRILQTICPGCLMHTDVSMFVYLSSVLRLCSPACCLDVCVTEQQLSRSQSSCYVMFNITVTVRLLCVSVKAPEHAWRNVRARLTVWGCVSTLYSRLPSLFFQKSKEEFQIRFKCHLKNPEPQEENMSKGNYYCPNILHKKATF